MEGTNFDLTLEFVGGAVETTAVRGAAEARELAVGKDAWSGRLSEGTGATGKTKVLLLAELDGEGREEDKDADGKDSVPVMDTEAGSAGRLDEAEGITVSLDDTAAGTVDAGTARVLFALPTDVANDNDEDDTVLSGTDGTDVNRPALPAF